MLGCIGKLINDFYRRYVDKIQLDGVLHSYVCSILYLISIMLLFCVVGLGYVWSLSISVVFVMFTLLQATKNAEVETNNETLIIFSKK